MASGDLGQCILTLGNNEIIVVLVVFTNILTLFDEKFNSSKVIWFILGNCNLDRIKLPLSSLLTIGWAVCHDYYSWCLANVLHQNYNNTSNLAPLKKESCLNKKDLENHYIILVWYIWKAEVLGSWLIMNTIFLIFGSTTIMNFFVDIFICHER